MKLDKEGNVLPPKAPAEATGVRCHKCKTGELVIRQSKRGPFMGCNQFPRCRTIVSAQELDNLKDLQAAGKWPPATPEEAEAILGREKKGGKGKAKAAPKAAAESTGLKCHRCRGGEFVVKKGQHGPFMGCNQYPKCKTIVGYKELDRLKELQAEGGWPPATEDEAEAILGANARGTRSRA
jgi:ssDNA-binding Zn-finger/Zn-ribbon topoisomerase 1